jgi:hypothetical protein
LSSRLHGEKDIWISQDGGGEGVRIMPGGATAPASISSNQAEK